MGRQAETLGERGLEIREFALGIDDRAVIPYRETKWVGAETTMPTEVEEVETVTCFSEAIPTI